MKWTITAVCLLLLLFACQAPNSDFSISLSVDPTEPTVNSTVTLMVNASLDIGVTLANLTVDGETVCSSSTLPLTYVWKPQRAKTYLIEGHVENIFGEKIRDQRVIEVRDITPPRISALEIVPEFPEVEQKIFLSMTVEEPESDYIKVAASVNNEVVEHQFSHGPVVIEVPQIDTPGTYPLNVSVWTSETARDATLTSLKVYPVDTGAPQLDWEPVKATFSEEEDAIISINAVDDSTLRDVIVTVDGQTVHEGHVATAQINDYSVSLGALSTGLHSVVVTVSDERSKTTVRGGTVAIGLGPVDVSLIVSNDNPDPNELISLKAETSEPLIETIRFEVDGNIICEGSSFEATWKAESGRHVLSVYVTTTDGKSGTDSLQIDVRDSMPPRITMFQIGTTDLKTDTFEQINSGCYGVRMEIQDDTALKQGDTILLVASSEPFPSIKPVFQIILVQESLSNDMMSASYVGAVELTQGRFYIIPSGVSDIYDNETKNLQYLLEVK